MTFAVLRALHAIIADALDDIQRVYDTDPFPVSPGAPPSICEHEGKKYPYVSPPPTPSVSTHSSSLDFPSLDAPYDPTDPAEQLTAHPTVVVAINKVVAAAGQMAAIVQTPFLSLCDASMSYHLPSCMRLLEASHTIEILREAGPQGLHVDAISQRNGVESAKLAHILRLLATHHIIRERSPNIFTMNRISSLLDSGKSVAQIRQWESEARPEMKYHDTNGISAFVGLSTDELQKSAAYMTEAYLLSQSKSPRTPFEYAFGTDVGFFEWLEGEEEQEKVVPKWNRSRQGSRDEHGVEMGLGSVGPAALGKTTEGSKSGQTAQDKNPNRYRLERFGKAMSGSVSWEVPAAVLNGFDWHALPRGSVIVDVGGGIGSTTMLLANAFSRARAPDLSPGGDEQGLDLGFEFVIQDRQVVVEMGEKAWRSKCPELLDSGTVRFQVHDFFTTQPIKNAAVFFLRVILHDWPDSRARMILLKLREAATEHTKLVLADFILPLACADDIGPGKVGDADAETLDGVEGAESILAPAPLLANLGKASANAYWMDLTMQVTFNSRERTLREIVTLALSAGWKVTKATRGVGSLFGHIVAVPVPIPMQKRARAGSGSAFFNVPKSASSGVAGASEIEAGREMEFIERAASRCGTPTFGSRMDLPSVQETMARFGGGVARTRGPGLTGKAGGSTARPGILKPSVVLTAPPVKKKKPSPLSFPPPSSNPPAPTSPLPRQAPPIQIARQMSQAQLYRPPSQQEPASPVPAASRQIPPSPMSPRHPSPKTLTRRASHAQLCYTSQTPPIPKSPPPPLPTSTSRPPPPISPHPRLPRRMSLAQLYQPAHTASSSIPPPPADPRQFPAPTLLRRTSRAQLYQPPATPQSLIPIRQIRDNPPSPSAALAFPHPVPPSSSPIISRHTPMARSGSYVQVPHTPLRNRSGSVIGPSRSAGIGGSISMASLLDGGGGGVLKFKSHEDDGHDMSRHSPLSATAGSGGSILAAAAKIERGIPPVPPSP